MSYRVTISKVSGESDLIKIYIDTENFSKSDEKNMFNDIKTAVEDLKDFNRISSKIMSIK